MSRTASNSSNTSSTTTDASPAGLRTDAAIRQRLLKDPGSASVMDAECAARGVTLVRAFANCLDAARGGSGRAAAGAGRRRSNGASVVSVQDDSDVVPSGVVSLTEMMARQVGWGIEDAVMSCCAANGSEDEDGGRLARGTLDEGVEDQMALVDEWYNACPDYCSRWLFAQHATCIVVDGAYELPLPLVECLFDTCVSAGAAAECLRLFDVLNDLCLSATAPPTDAFGIANRAALLGQSTAYFASLKSILLSSSFSERFFYSSFLSLSRWQLSPGRERLVTQHLKTICQVGREMLVSITAAGSTGVVGGDRLMDEIVARVAKEIDFALPLLLDRNADTGSERHEALRTVSQCAWSLIDVHGHENGLDDHVKLVLFDVQIELLSAELAGGASPTEDTVSRLVFLDTIVLEEGEWFLHQWRPRSERFTIPVLLVALEALYSLNLLELESFLLCHVLQAYGRPLDVRSSDRDARVWNVDLETRNMDLHRLREAKKRVSQTDTTTPSRPTSSTQTTTPHDLAQHLRMLRDFNASPLRRTAFGGSIDDSRRGDDRSNNKGRRFGAKPIDTLDLSMEDSENDLVDDDDDSSSDSQPEEYITADENDDSVIESKFKFEILPSAPTFSPTSEGDDLDLLSQSRHGARHGQQHQAFKLGTKRRAAMGPEAESRRRTKKQIKLVRFQTRSSQEEEAMSAEEESEDELGM